MIKFHSNALLSRALRLLTIAAIDLAGCNSNSSVSSQQTSDAVVDSLYQEVAKAASDPAVNKQAAIIMNGKASDFMSLMVSVSPTVLNAMGGDAKAGFANIDKYFKSVKAIMSSANVSPTTISRADLALYVRFTADVFTPKGFRKGWINHTSNYSPAEIASVIKISSYLTQIHLKKTPKVFLSDAPQLYLDGGQIQTFNGQPLRLVGRSDELALDNWSHDSNDDRPYEDPGYPSDAARAGAAALARAGATMRGASATNYGYNMGKVNTECKPSDSSVNGSYGVAVTEQSPLFPGVCARNGNYEPDCKGGQGYACGAKVRITNEQTGKSVIGFISGICPAEHSVNASKSPNPCPRGGNHVDLSRAAAVATGADGAQTNTYTVAAQ